MMYGNAMGPFGWIMMIVITLAAVALIVWVVRSTAPTGRRDSDPIDILKRRLALGEIDSEEYEKRRKLLGD